MSKSFEQAINILLASADGKETKSVLQYISAANPGLMESMSIGCLKQSKMLVGGIGKCSAFLPVGIYVEGWFFPTNKYDCIEIYSGEKFIANAHIGIQRKDVYKNFPFFNEPNAGFCCFITEELDTIEKNKTLAVIVKKDGKTIRKIVQEVSSYSVKDSLEELERNLHEKNNILIPILSNRIGLLAEIARQLPDYNFVTLVEGMEPSVEEAVRHCIRTENLSPEDINRLSLWMVPDLLRRNNVPGYSRMALGEIFVREAKKDQVLWTAALNFQTKYNVSEEYAVMFCLQCLEYAREAIRIVGPAMIMIWNKYSPWHRMLEQAAGEAQIPVVYMENGVLPGTLIFETGGQMGESYPAVHAEEFSALEVEDRELQAANEIWDRLYENKLNRWISSNVSVYKEEEADQVRSRLNSRWPTILYAAQNDFESGLYPYTENTKKYHSPIFESSEEAAVFLGKLAEKNHWNLIYKRHPMMRGKPMAELPENIILSDEINIHDAVDISDLVITVLSQTSYVSLIRQKPALMLGFHQLNRKGCIYETDKRGEIEETIRNALTNGFTEEQRRNFRKHIAQLCKYYLYRDFTNADIDYGKPVSDLKDYLIQVMEGSGCPVRKGTEITYEASGREAFAYKTEDERAEERFTLRLSFMERIKRRQLKRNIGDFHKIYRAVMGKGSRKDFSECMMLISQIDGMYLDKKGWPEIFSEICRKYILEGEESLETFLTWTDRLHEEIKIRLGLDRVIHETAKKMLQKDIAYVNWAFSPTHVKRRNLFLCELQHYMEEMKNLEDRDLLFQEFMEQTHTNDLEKCYLFEMIFRAGYFSQALMQEWMRLLLASEEEDILYYFGVMELDRIAFLHPEAVYDSYYSQRNELLKRSSAIFNKYRHWERPHGSPGKRIGLLVVGLHGKNYASARLQTGIANGLSRNGWDVTIYVADTNYISAGDIFMVNPSTVRRNFSKDIFQREHWMMADTGVEIKYFNYNENGKARYERLIKTVYEDNPAAIIDITNEQGIYNVQLIKDFPVISIPLNGYASSSVSSVYIGRNRKYILEQEKKFGKVDTDCIMEANLYLPYQVTKEKYSRAQFGFRKEDFLFVTVGNRLDYEITDDIKEKMKHALNANYNYRWIIVGATDREKFKLLEKEIASQKVILWGYENFLYKLYYMCDVYLDLPRSGGGGSTALAVQCGIPAIITDGYSDILPFLGEENAVPDFDSSLEKLKELSESKVKRKQLHKEEYKNLMGSKWSLENYVRVTEAAIDKAIKERERKQVRK